MNQLLLLSVCGVLFISCNKSIEKEEIPKSKKSQNLYNGACGKKSNMLSRLTIPFDIDEKVGQAMINITAEGIASGDNYIKIKRDETAQAYIIQLMKYTDSYPAHKPSANKTVYEGKDAQNMAIAYYTAWLNLDCTPVEWFAFNGVYYVEDCC